MKNTILLFILFLSSHLITAQILLPVNSENRNSVESIELTGIGKFATWRKARPNVPAHYHTGMDIKRPNKNYVDEPIFPVAKGVVISRRDDGAYAQLIIHHKLDGLEFWSVYDHVAGIEVSVGDTVSTKTKIARFMTSDELKKYGWHFDHVHLEIMKVPPGKINPNKYRPQRFYRNYSLICYTRSTLDKYYYDPMEFFKEQFVQ